MVIKERINKINLPIVNLLLYACLLVATPFIMLQNYLQSSVAALSAALINIIGIDVPIIPLFSIALLAVFIFYFYKKLSLKLGIVFIFILGFIGFGQWISDYYINYKVYDLQNNWHYFAYCLFSIIIYSFFKQKLVSMHRINFFVFFVAAVVSLFDELFQNLLSQRIFDLSDVAKDLWGVSAGLIIINFLIEKNNLKLSVFKIRKKKVKDYFKDEMSGLLLILIFSFFFLWISSLLTEVKYWLFVIVISALFFTTTFALIHFWSGRIKRFLQVTILLAILMLVVSFSFNQENSSRLCLGV